MALDFFAGCLGGCAGLLVGHPFDTIKVHLQTQDYRNPVYRGTYDCMKKIILKDSIAGLYRGISSPILSISALNAIVFGVYGNVQRRTTDPNALITHFFAGSAAGISQSIICSPMELVKSRMQVQNSIPNALKHSSPWAALRHIAKTQGIRGVYKGMGITIFRDVPGFASYFVSFEWLMRQEKNPSAFYTLMAGGFAGTFSWLFSFPVDVVKSRLQVDGIDGTTKYKGAVDCMKKSYHEEGLKFFTRGLTSTLLRAFPMNAVCFLVVSYVMKFFDEKAIDVTVAQPVPLTIVDTYQQQSLISQVFTRAQNELKEKSSKYKYLILLDGFHEVACHADMIDLSDGLREKRSNTTYFYKITDELLVGNLSEDEMRTPLSC